MLDFYWVLRDEKTGLYLVRFVENGEITYDLHPSWKEAIKCTGLEGAQILRKKLVGDEGKKSPWIGLKTRKIKITIE